LLVRLTIDDGRQTTAPSSIVYYLSSEVEEENNMTTTSFTEHRRWSSARRWVMLGLFNMMLVAFMLQIFMPAIASTPFGHLWIFTWIFIFLIPTNIMQWLLAVSVLRVNQKWLRLPPWVILSFIGSAVGSLFLSPVSYMIVGQHWVTAKSVVDLLLLIGGSMCYSVGIGIGQWLCLPDRRANFWWIIVNTIGFVMAYGLYHLR
jgi:hypothetical protein